MTVCIAEDDHSSCLMLETIARKWGYTTISARDGEGAWQLVLTSQEPLIILLDWNMPECNGLDLARKIRGLSLSVPHYIIMVTGKDDRHSIVEALNAGANDYVSKPYDAEILKARINVGKRMLELQAGLLQARDELLHEATHDALTGTLNRRAILRSLNAEISRANREQTKLALGILDIDKFKSVNDDFGHQAGDEALCGFVDRLRTVLRDYDLLGRWGGDEFLVVFPGLGHSDLDSLKLRLAAVISEQPIVTNRGPLSISASIGLASFTGKESEQGLIAAADDAMYHHKSSD